MKQQATSVLSFLHRDADEVASFLSGRFAPIKIQPHAKTGIVSMSGQFGRLRGIDFSKTEFQAGFRLIPQKKDPSFFFIFPKQGALISACGSTKITADLKQAVQVDGEECDYLEPCSGYLHFSLTVNKLLMTQRLALLLDRQISRKIEFVPIVQYGTKSITALEHLLSYVVEGSFGQIISDSPIATARMSHLLAEMILETWPHNFSEELKKPPDRIHPKHVKIAKEYIDAHPLENIGAEELAQLSGVSMRALQYGFRDFVGMPIGQYARRRRLEGAKMTILSGSHSSVKEVAILWGFTNLHRFNLEFKATFGIQPRELKNDIL